MSPPLLSEELQKTHHRMTGDPRTLTSRELEILGWVAKGKTNRDIGKILQISPRTVSKHLEHVYVKLGVEGRTAAVLQFIVHAQLQILSG